MFTAFLKFRKYFGYAISELKLRVKNKKSQNCQWCTNMYIKYPFENKVVSPLFVKTYN